MTNYLTFKKVGSDINYIINDVMYNYTYEIANIMYSKLSYAFANNCFYCVKDENEFNIIKQHIINKAINNKGTFYGEISLKDIKLCTQ